MIALLLALAALSPEKQKLRPGAEGKLCLDCHSEFQTKLNKPAVHTPVKKQQCIGCHNPHAAKHGKMLDAAPSELCATCHGAMAPASAKSVHKPVADRNCTSCHDPHSSDVKNQLLGKGAALCAKCHQKLVDTSVRAKFGHPPVKQNGCNMCHEAHASTQSAGLLKFPDQKTLCLSCHEVKRRAFIQKHGGYPVQQASCTECHDPHGSDRRGMLYEVAHKPAASGQCGECHVAPTSATPFATRKQGVALCKQCHAAQIGTMLEKSRVHDAVVDPEGCVNCHTPHASKQQGLLKGRLTEVCGACHADTIARQERSPTAHPPVRNGDCATCHDPHSSDAPLMLKKANNIQRCEACHDYERHSTHPIGEKLKDPRNPNLTMDCLSCHRAHGTEYKHMIPFPTTTELCTKCHEQYKR